MKVIYIKKKEFDIYYDCKLKYPVCVVESFSEQLKDIGIDRKKIGEPFKADTELPKKCRLFWKDYLDAMMYGFSPGHNAPAGFHKTSLSNYTDTFLLSNICPQEVVFNSGRWVLLEKWCKKIIKKYNKVFIFTGSIKGKTRKFNKININIPSHMYKVIIVKKEGIYHHVSYLMPNESATDEFPISKFIISFGKLSKILKKMNFDIKKIIRKKGIKKTSKLKSENFDLEMTTKIKNQMRSSRLYGKIIYSKNMKELDCIYEKAKKENRIGYYHKLYYDLAKKRLSN